MTSLRLEDRDDLCSHGGARSMTEGESIGDRACLESRSTASPLGFESLAFLYGE